MRFRLRKERFTLEFSGSPAVWNACLRPYFGGPEAPPEPAAAPQPPLMLTPHRTEAGPAAVRPVQAPTSPAAPAPAPSPASPRPVPPAAPAGPRTWYPPRETPRTAVYAPAPVRAGAPEEDEPFQIETTNDPLLLYARLSAIPGRRPEREAVLAAVWFLTHGTGEVTPDDVERHFRQLGVFLDLRVAPHLLKHVTRTKMLEHGSQPRALKLSPKGVAHVRGRLVGE